MGQVINCPKCGQPFMAVLAPPPLNPPPIEPESEPEPYLPYVPSSETGLAPAGPRRIQLLVALFTVLILTVAVVLIAVAMSRREPATTSKATVKAPSTQRPAPPEAPQEFFLERRPSDGLSLSDRLHGGLAVGVVLVTAVVALIYLGFVFWMMSWVARDAYNRSHEGALWAIIYAVPHLVLTAPVSFLLFVPVVGWILMLPGLLVSWSGFLVYILSRRKGRLKRCPNCDNRHLDYVYQCPHCGGELRPA
jgi:hypothetical protein